MDKWYKLDNAAKLFPLITNGKNSSVFRVSAVLTEKVDKEVLQKAVDHIYDTFPMMFIKMHRGLFWNYFDNNYEKFCVYEEKEFPCSNINPFDNNGYLLKILYFNKRISVEMFHSLTDGGGAVELLKTILFYYIIFSGNNINDEGKIILTDRDISIEDTEDSYFKNYEKIEIKKQVLKHSFRIKGTTFDNYGNNVITGVVSANELNNLAKTKNASITSYLVSLIIYSIYMSNQKYTNDKKPIIAAVPVNLRKAFISKTLRNFANVVYIGMNIDENTELDDIIQEITMQLKTKTEKSELKQLIAAGMSLERKIYSRFSPLFLKKIFTKAAYYFGETKKTITISNIGNISVPEGFSPILNLMEAIMYTTPRRPVNCGICSVNGKLAISFSRIIEENDIIKYFFKLLSENTGLDLAVYSNNWGINLKDKSFKQEFCPDGQNIRKGWS